MLLQSEADEKHASPEVLGQFAATQSLVLKSFFMSRTCGGTIKAVGGMLKNRSEVTQPLMDVANHF